MEKPCEILKGKISNATKKNVWSQCRFFAARSGQYNFSIKLRVMDYKKRATTTSETEAPECSFRGRGTSLLISGHNMAPLIGLGQFLVTSKHPKKQSGCLIANLLLTNEKAVFCCCKTH